MDTELLKGTLSLLILSLLSRTAMYGYELAATVHRDTEGAFRWREGSLYPNLHKLEADGLIVGEWEEKETGRKRRYYHITKAGRVALKEKVQAWAELCKAVNCILEKSHGQA
jgi:transcriptional regulator